MKATFTKANTVRATYFDANGKEVLTTVEGGLVGSIKIPFDHFVITNTGTDGKEYVVGTRPSTIKH